MANGAEELRQMHGGTSGLSGENLRLALKLRPLSLGDVDKRTTAFRQADALRAALISDLGGEGRATAAELELVGRAATLSAMIQGIEARWYLGEPIDLADYLSATNAFRRVLLTLGLDRRARDVTPPSLREYLEGKAVNA